jgi:predicted small integral membrane protein
MGKIMRRLESGERWWAAEIAFRLLGLVLLALCGGAALWLFRSVHLPPPHEARPLEYLGALLAFLSWSLGWACFVEGPGLFKLIPVPARYRRFDL